MANSKRRKENYPLAIFLFFVLFLITAGWFIIPGLKLAFEESSQMSALQNRGTRATGCITAKDAHEGLRWLPELIYQFPTTNGMFEGRVKVTDEVFEQYQIGDCLEIVYVPENPIVSSVPSYVQAWNFETFWSEQLSFIPIVLVFALFVIVFSILNYFRRRAQTERNS